jgi:hypothetical protein
MYNGKGIAVEKDNSIEKPGFRRKPPHIRKFCGNPEKTLTRNPLTALPISHRSLKVEGAHIVRKLRK